MLNFGYPLAYLLYSKYLSLKAWDLEIDERYRPPISLIIPTFNEADVIEEKLRNVELINYPREKLQVIVVDSASDDGTLLLINNFIKRRNLKTNIVLLQEDKRSGKASALNLALRYCVGEIIITTDADAFLYRNSLLNAVKYFSDSRVGAVTGKEILLNRRQNVYTASEGLYRRFYYLMRLGESKVHSTLIFQGELSLYRKKVFEKFEDKISSDDTGTIIGIILKNYRCIYVPEAIFEDKAPPSLRTRFIVKSRRAQHLIIALLTIMKLKLKGKFPIQMTIIFSNFFLHIINPFLTIIFIIQAVNYIILFPWLTLLMFFLIFQRIRNALVLYVTDVVSLIWAMIRLAQGDRQIIWQKLPEM